MTRTHGTRSAYNAGCRCTDCKATNRNRSRKVRAVRMGAKLPGTTPAPDSPGPAELAVIDDCARLSAAQSRPSSVAALRQLARILDDPDAWPIHVRAFKSLHDGIQNLRKLSGDADRRRGRLASVQPMRKGGN
jgi:hypothetical protein